MGRREDNKNRVRHDTTARGLLLMRLSQWQAPVRRMVSRPHRRCWCSNKGLPLRVMQMIRERSTSRTLFLDHLIAILSSCPVRASKSQQRIIMIGCMFFVVVITVSAFNSMRPCDCGAYEWHSLVEYGARARIFSCCFCIKYADGTRRVVTRSVLY